MRSRRQRMGQHFLRDRRVAAGIVEALPSHPDQVIEIGPGRGALTHVLLTRFARVRAIELDSGLAGCLRERLGSPPTLEVVEGDAASADLDELTGGEPWLVAANLPYSVATPILRRLVQRGDLFPTLVVMVQREVAARLTAPAGGAERGYLSVLVEAYASARYLFSVPARAFSPPPRVVSAVVELKPRLRESPAPAPDRVLALAAAAFSHRRKKLTNALSSLVEPSLVDAALRDIGARAEVRPQELSWEQWLALAEALPEPGES